MSTPPWGVTSTSPGPTARTALSRWAFWGFYPRDLRVGAIFKLAIRRARCRRCARSHALLPDFVAHRRLDGIEVIGAGIEAMADGATVQSVASTAGVPHATARTWRRRVLARAEALTAGFWAACVAWGDLVPVLGGPGILDLLLGAVRAAVGALGRRLGVGGALWKMANRIVGGHLLSTNTDMAWVLR
jgi:hypothetical protein